MNSRNLRNLIAFFLLGLTNNYAYIVMLSAAHDMLKDKDKSPNDNPYCNSQSTGLILIFDIIPSLIVKLIAPFINGFTNFKILINVFFIMTSFILTGLSVNQYITYIGVIFASLASGLGESTFLGYISKYETNVFSTWSSGTGAAGFFGSLSYLFLTWIGFTPKASILFMLIIPIIMFFTFFFVLTEPDETTNPLINTDNLQIEETFNENISLRTKLGLIKSLKKYMVPLCIVYFCEYFINQGLSELIFFEKSFFSHDLQYRFYQAEYQLGVLISRSSINFITIDKLWILPIIQFINLNIILIHILNPFLGSFWVVSIIILFEGLIGGAAYANSFNKIKKTDEINLKHKEFCMSITCIADTLGIAISGFISMRVHSILCKYIKNQH